MDHVKAIESIDLGFAEINLREDGILHIHLGLEYEINIVQTKEIFECSKKMMNGTPYPHLFTVTKFVLPSNETRDFMVSLERMQVTLADAFVIHTFPQKLIGNFYLKMNTPKKPTKMFSSDSEALKWLYKFVK